MQNITGYMASDHKNCDDAFVNFENIITQANWPEISKLWGIFVGLLTHHFDMEEKELFPAFENATGMMGGPTMVMRGEHQQMRSLVAAIDQAIVEQNQQDCLGVAETLMMMMQQHNMKEEQMLYPMADQHLDSKQVVELMKSVDA